MSIFSVQSGKCIRIKETKFNYEKDLQGLVERNLAELFGLEFIKSEFTVKGTRQSLSFDTLAFDPQAEAFVIIEYKKDRNFSVIDQGYSYLAALVNNKAEAILEYQEQKNSKLRKSNVDWNATRVIFVAPQFTAHQMGAIEFKDVPFELWEAQSFENGLFSLSPVKSAESKDSIVKFIDSPAVKNVSEQVRTFTFEEHRERASSEVQALLDDLRTKIFELDPSVKEKPVQNYLGYKINWYNFVAIHVYRDKLKAYVRVAKLDNDPQNRFKNVPSSYGAGNTTPLWWIDVSNLSDLNYLMPSIEQSYRSAPDR